MRATAYRWVCHKCEIVNERGTSVCSQCGFSAVATALEIAQARGEENPVSEGYKALAKGTGWLAYFAALFSP